MDSIVLAAQDQQGSPLLAQDQQGSPDQQGSSLLEVQRPKESAAEEDAEEGQHAVGVVPGETLPLKGSCPKEEVLEAKPSIEQMRSDSDTSCKRAVLLGAAGGICFIQVDSSSSAATWLLTSINLAMTSALVAQRDFGVGSLLDSPVQQLTGMRAATLLFGAASCCFVVGMITFLALCGSWNLGILSLLLGLPLCLASGSVRKCGKHAVQWFSAQRVNDQDQQQMSEASDKILSGTESHRTTEGSRDFAKDGQSSTVKDIDQFQKLKLIDRELASIQRRLMKEEPESQAAKILSEQEKQLNRQSEELRKEVKQRRRASVDLGIL